MLVCVLLQCCNLIFPDETPTRDLRKDEDTKIDMKGGNDVKMGDIGPERNRDTKRDLDAADFRICGDGRIDEGEECDRTSLQGKSCSDFLFERGDLSCNSQCTWDLTHCSTCGDGIISGKEQCDGGELDGASCESTAINGVESFGVLGCDMRCDFDRTQCKTKFSEISVGKRFPPSPLPPLQEHIYYGHNCAIRTNGTIVCWGTKGGGEDVDASPSGVFLSISSGVKNNCAIRTNGSAQCWPDALPQNLSTEIFSEISVGQNHACGLRKIEKSIVCWGDNADGRATVPEPNELFKQVQVGSRHSCGLKLDGRIVCWGFAGNINPMTGMVFETDQRLVPPVGSFESIAINYIGGCALDTFGRALCWPNRAPSPDSNLAFEKVWVRVLSPNNSNGQGKGGYGCGILKDSKGRVKCWGVEAQDQFPDENLFYLDFGIGDVHSCAIKQNQEIVCFGYDGGSGAKDYIPQ